MNAKILSLALCMSCGVSLFAQDWYNEDYDSDTVQPRARVSQTDDQEQNTVSSVTQDMFVAGTCDQCKLRIETTVLGIPGVTYAKYNLKKQSLKLKFNPKVTTIDIISKELAKVGHDTDKYKADPNVYNKLPNCCKYRK